MSIVTFTDDSISIFARSSSLEDLAWALAEGEHNLGDAVTAIGNSVVQWPGQDCPWFVPGPTPVTEIDENEARYRWNHGESTIPADYDLPF